MSGTPTKSFSGQYFFALCAPGFENRIKEDALAFTPLKFAYSSKGLITFKSDIPDDRSEGESLPFSWIFGNMLGRISLKSFEHSANRQKDLAPFEIKRALVHHLDASSNANVGLVEELGFHGPKLGEPLHDLIVDTKGGFLWVGMHEFRRGGWGSSPFDAWREAQAEDLVDGLGFKERYISRAYFKAKHVYDLLSPPMIKKGANVVQIGAAPGGMSLFFLEQGARVTAVDAAKKELMDPKLFDMMGFTFIQETLARLRREDLPQKIDALALDVNVAGPTVIEQAIRLRRVRKDRPTLILTLKQPRTSSLAKWREMIEEQGYRKVWIGHLPSNRDECTLVAY